MITWKPCHGGGCVQTGTDDYGRVWVRNSSGFSAVDFTRAEWDAHLDSIRREERQRAAALLETAWGVIANAGWDANDREVAGRAGGWHDAAVRWRDKYHEWLRDLLDGDGDGRA